MRTPNAAHSAFVDASRRANSTRRRPGFSESHSLTTKVRTTALTTSLSMLFDLCVELPESPQANRVCTAPDGKIAGRL